MFTSKEKIKLQQTPTDLLYVPKTAPVLSLNIIPTPKTPGLPRVNHHNIVLSPPTLNEIVKQNRRVRQRLCTSVRTGKAYVQELLEGSSIVMYNMMRMEPDSFRSLVAHFRDTGLLRDSKHIDVDEKLAIFLHIIAHNMRNRAINTLFQHSAATTSKVFHECLDAMIKFSKEMIVPTNFDEPPRPIRHNLEVDLKFITRDGENCKLSIDERMKFNEETLVNVNNIMKRQSTRNQRYSGFSNEYIVAFEVLWTPQNENDTLLEWELLEDYPRLRPV
ncbi:hypothetical protein GIB67_029033 [Kingdonia uniflora]|uniref:DUF8040 domain-containing protein n=1 Tax=Kingdonia uniflora TaxID=39325 RepID=A0A7J7N6W1_9MAGN|nr:hypothetical protein GIB67_029033 [Kingdonia uniflora]